MKLGSPSNLEKVKQIGTGLALILLPLLLLLRARQQMPVENEFSTALYQSVRYVLENILGEKPTLAIYGRLQSLDISINPKKLHDALYPVFKQGALVLEGLIVKDLSQKLKVPYEEKEPFDFEREVNFAKQVFVTSTKDVPS